jgi:hypothetical protein
MSLCLTAVMKILIGLVKRKRGICNLHRQCNKTAIKVFQIKPTQNFEHGTDFKKPHFL